MTKFHHWIFKVIVIFSIGSLLCRKSDGSTRAPLLFKCTGKPSRTTDGSLLAVSQTTATSFQSSHITTAPSTKKDTECPSHYVVSFNNSCYKFYHHHSFSRSAAQSHCESEYAHLVYIESKDENDFIVGELLNERKYWIGLHSAERHLYWDNGAKVMFSNLLPEKFTTFNDGSECYRLRGTNNLWLDTPCDNEREYICEYEDIQDDSCPSGYENLFEDSCYKIVDDHPLNHSSAKSNCESDSAHLLFIESEQEDKTLKQSLESPYEFWIGLWSEPRRLYWDDNNEAVFTYLEPDMIDTFNDGSGCYHVGIHEERLWVDGPCNVTYGYICEFELNM